jgi:hypothetical protein
MPIDANVIAGIKPAPIGTVEDSLKRVETERVRAQSLRDQQTFEQIAKETNGDPDAMMQAIRARIPHAAPAFEAQLTKVRKERADALKVELDNETTQITRGLGLMRSIRDERSYQAIKPTLMKIAPDIAPLLPEAFDPNALQKLGEMGLTAKEHADLTRKALDDYLGGKWRNGLGTALSIAQDEEDWNEAIEGFLQMGGPKSEAALFGTFSPENVQRAAQLTMDPNTRQDNAIAKQNADTAAANAAKSGATAGFSLSPGQRRYDANGQLIATAPDRPRAAGGSGAPSGDDALVDTIIAEPGLWDQLTPTVKGRIAAKLKAKGYEGFGKPMSDGAMKQVAESESAIDSLKDLRTTLQKNEQYLGPVAGLSALNPYSGARKAQSEIDLVRQRVGKALEGGVLRKEDEEKYKKILATLRDVPETAVYKIDQLIKTLENDIANFKHQQRLGGKRVAESPSGGLPKVGDTFNGGRVLKVTPIP